MGDKPRTEIPVRLGSGWHHILRIPTMSGVKKVLIVGNGVLGWFLAKRMKDLGLEVQMVGKGKPMERFIILQENAIKVLEKTYGDYPGQRIRGIRVLDLRGRTKRRLEFGGSRMASVPYHALLSFVEGNSPKVDLVSDFALSISPSGEVKTQKGLTLKGDLVAVATGKPMRKTLVWRHKKFYFGFVDLDVEREWILQVNDRGFYAVITPFEDGRCALATSSQDVAPLRRIFGGFEWKPVPLDLTSYYTPFWRRGKVVYLGDSVRRFHPHTTQGINRALWVADRFVERGFKVSPVDLLGEAVFLLEGILLDMLWGSHPLMINLSYFPLTTAPGRALLSGTF